MHRFLSAVGFSKIKNRKTLEPIFKQVIQSPSSKIISIMSDDTFFVQLNKDFGNGFGLSLIGEISSNSDLSIEYYFPYVHSNFLTDIDSIFVENYSDKQAYVGMSNDYGLGMTLMFFINNVADYEKSKWMNKSNEYFSQVYLSGLSDNGTILLDVDKPEENHNSFSNGKRKKLIEAAKKGDPSAIESLTLEDMDIYNLIEKRTKYEDVLTIVESSFIPIGIEPDHYEIIGNITSFVEQKNSYTEESVYLLDIECNDLLFTIAINENDLLGEPAVGRRFKGIIWLQGHVVI